MQPARWVLGNSAVRKSEGTFVQYSAGNPVGCSPSQVSQSHERRPTRRRDASFTIVGRAGLNFSRS
jgi:hypothetical protein